MEIHYPEAVSWFSVNVGKEKHGKGTNFDIAEYLGEEEIQKLIVYLSATMSYCVFIDKTVLISKE
jgi:hypothetical protein